MQGLGRLIRTAPTAASWPCSTRGWDDGLRPAFLESLPPAPDHLRVEDVRRFFAEGQTPFDRARFADSALPVGMAWMRAIAEVWSGPQWV